MATVSAPVVGKVVRAPRLRGRLEGIDLARALALLAMLTTHTLITPVTRAEEVLWFAKGPTAPLFVMLAGTGLSLATRSPRRPRTRAMIVVRAALLLLIGLWLATQMQGAIIQYYALYFLIGICFVGLATRALAALAGLFVVGGPLLLTALLRAGHIESYGTGDVGLDSLGDPVALVRTLALEGSYPAAVWLGFFFTGMALGRLDLTSTRTMRQLFVGASAAASVAYAAGWYGARTFAPAEVDLASGLKLAPEWSYHWTTYGHTEALAWAVASTAFGVAAVGACLIAATRIARSRLLGPPVALGQMALTFYLLHLWYVDTLWKRFDPHLTNFVAYVAATLAFWLIFALLAQRWMRRMAHGPLESAINAVASLVVGLRPRLTRR